MNRQSPRIRPVKRGGLHEHAVDGMPMETGEEFKAFVEEQKGSRTFAAPYALAIWDKQTGRLTPGFEEFARLLAYGRALPEAWGESFPDAPYTKLMAKQISFHPLITARVTHFHAQKLKIEAHIRRQTLEAKNITYEWLIERAAENVILGQGDSIVRFDPTTKSARIIDGKQDLAASNRALEMLGKERAAFLDQRPKMEQQRAYEDLDDREIDAELEAARRQLGITVSIVVNGNGHASATAFRDGATVIDAEPSDDGRGQAPRPERARIGAPAGEDPTGDAPPA